MIENVKRLFSESMRKRRLTVTIASFVAFSSAVSVGAYEVTKETVTVKVNGEQKVVRTHAKTVEELLEDLKVELRPEDRITPGLNSSLTDDMLVSWVPAKPISVYLDGQKQTVWSAAKTVKELLAENHISIAKQDTITPSLDSKVSENTKISIGRAFSTTLTVGGQSKEVWSTSTTVADFLEKNKITLGKLDRVEPAMDAVVTKGATVTVTRVEKVTDVVEETVDFAVVTKKDKSITKGKKQVVTKGEKGVVAKHYDVVLENGKVVSRKLSKTVTVKEGKDQVVAVGTKVQRTVSRGSSEVADEFYVSSTAYTAYCPGCSGKTATGVNLRANPSAKVIAVDPDVIPLGTKVYVEGYGYAIAADTGRNIQGNKIDVFFPETSDAYQWGSKKVKIKILK